MGKSNGGTRTSTSVAPRGLTENEERIVRDFERAFSQPTELRTQPTAAEGDEAKINSLEKPEDGFSRASAMSNGVRAEVRAFSSSGDMYYVIKAYQNGRQVHSYTDWDWDGIKKRLKNISEGNFSY